MSKTIIERMCNIDEKVFSGKLEPLKQMDKASADIKALQKTLCLTPVQILILTAIIQLSTRFSIEGSRIADRLGLSYLQFLTYNRELEDLRKKGYLFMNKDGDFLIPKRVKDTLIANRPVTPEPISGLDSFQLLSRIKNALERLQEDISTLKDIRDELCILFENNRDSSVGSRLLYYSQGLSDGEAVLLYLLVYHFYYEDDDMVGWHDVDNYIQEEELARLRNNFKREALRLQWNGIIECTGDGSFLSKDYFHIKDDIKDLIFADMGGGIKKPETKVSAARELKAGDIGAKAMFYNPAEGRQVAQLKDLMSEKRFNDIRGKIRSKGMRTGFTCLFYGAPGTGKTETVYQISRQCGRDLFIVDVSQIKSCWVGESEKKIKDVFVKYRKAVEDNKTVPILLFNEADAIFGIRQEGAERAVDKMENTIQNIILQEMEDLDGILIATTNLTTNLDKAFERRFLYKIRFEKPSLQASASIWRTMIPQLTQSQAEELAGSYSFSGGQIENVARKNAINAILSEQEPDFGQIRSFCAEENIDNAPQRKRIGF